MLHDLSVLLKHKVFMDNAKGKSRNKYGLIYLIVFACGFLFLISKNMVDIYNQMAVLTFNHVNFGDIYMNFVVTIFSLFFILSFSSMMSFQLKRNEEIDFLMTLPIRKSSIVSYHLIISGVSMVLFLVLYLAPVLAFFMNKSLLFITLGAFGVTLSIILLIFMSALFAVLFSKIASQKFIRVMMIIVNLIYAGAYLLMFQMIPGNIMNTEEIPGALQKADQIFRSDFNLFTLGINAGEKPYFLLVLFALVIVFGFMYFRVSNRLNFTKGKIKMGKKHLRETNQNSNALLKKELIIYRRNEQLIYYIFYPVGFGTLMGFVNKDFFTGLFSISLMGLMFITMQTAFSMSLEGSSISLTKLLPIDLKKFIRTKLLVPVMINFLLLVFVFIIFNVFLDVNPLTFILLPIITLVQILAALSGIAFSVKTPPQKMSNPGAFMRSGSFIIQFLLLMIIGLITILPVSIFLFHTIGTATLMSNLLLIAVSVAGIVLTLFISVRLWNTIKKRILIWC